LQRFEKPLRAVANDKSRAILQPAEITALFGNLPSLQTLHSEFVRLLEQNVNQGSENIGRVFLQFVPFLKSYTDYAKQYGSASDLLQKLKKRPVFRNFILEIANKMQSVIILDVLDSLLIMPIQRIPRYVLLFSDLLQAGGSDTAEIKQALTMVEDVAARVNESVKDSDTLQHLYALQQALKGKVLTLGDLNSAARIYIKHGQVQLSCNGVVRKLFMFLFNDVVIFVKEKRGGFNFEFHIPIGQVKLNADAKSIATSFTLEHPAENLLATVILATADEHKAWLAALQHQLEQRAPK
jgi:hypothetical protein